MKLRAGLLAAAALLASGCELTNETIVAEKNDFTKWRHLAVAMFGDVVWVSRTNQNPYTFEARDPDDGELLATLGGWTGAFALAGLYKAYDNGFEDNVWVLHSNGWRTRWAPDGAITGAETQIPSADFPADSRTVCEMVRDPWGRTYLSSFEQLGGVSTHYVYRHEGGQYTRVATGAIGCMHIDFDIATNEVAVLAYTNGYLDGSVKWYAMQDLSLAFEVDTGAFSLVNDFAAFNHNTAWCGGSVYLLDPTAAVTDQALENCWAVDVYYGDNNVQLWWSGETNNMPGEPEQLGYYDLQ